MANRALESRVCDWSPESPSIRHVAGLARLERRETTEGLSLEMCGGVSGICRGRRSWDSRCGIGGSPYVVGDLGGLSADYDVLPGFLTNFEASLLAED